MPDAGLVWRSSHFVFANPCIALIRTALNRQSSGGVLASRLNGARLVRNGSETNSADLH